MVVKSKKKTRVPASRASAPAPAETPVVPGNPADKTIDQLILDLGDPDEMIRSVAAGTLGFRKSDQAVGPLILALQDPHIWVRHGAAWALGEIRSEKAIDALKDALNDEDETTRGKAAEALGKIQGG